MSSIPLIVSLVLAAAPPPLEADHSKTQLDHILISGLELRRWDLVHFT
jgi:hypothetical protein